MAFMTVSCSKSAESSASSDTVSVQTAKADSCVKVEDDSPKGLTEEDAKIIEFLTDMYDNHKYEDYDFLRAHCTEKLLNKLSQKYDYECSQDVCYAIWLFRTQAQDGPSNRSEIVRVKPEGDGWYTYDFYDMGIKGRNRVRVFVKDGVVMMDDILNILMEGAE